MRRWLLLLVPVLLAVLPTGPAAHAADGGAPAPAAQAQTFGIQPATATDPDNRGSFSYAATPGAVVRDHVAVWNYGDRPVTLRLYPADAFNTDTGGYDVLPEGRPSTMAGAWIRTATASLTLPARSRQIVPFTVAVPAGATPGDHAAGIVAALRQETKDAKGNAVTLDQRVGARVHLRVAGALKAELTVEDVHAVHHPSANPLGAGRTTVDYTVRNTGNVRLGGRQAVRVTNVLGTVATGTAPADLQELLPGNAVHYRVEVSGAYPTFWGTAGVTVDPLPIAGDKDPNLAGSTRKQRFASIPWALLAVLLPAGLIAWYRWRRRTPTTPAADRTGSAGPGKAAAREAVAGTALLAVLLLAGQFGAAPAARAADTGTLAFDYATGHDDDAVDVLTSGRCPDPDTAYLAMRITGAGFPAEGAPLTGTVAASVYRHGTNGGYVLPMGNTLRVVANRSGAGPLHGAYTVTASCRGKVNPASRRDFTGVLTFTSPTTWQAVTVAPQGALHGAAADPVPAAAPAVGTPATGTGKVGTAATGTGKAGETGTGGPWIAAGVGTALLAGLAALAAVRLRRRPGTTEGENAA
ncbi:hypothetical protein [Kitasatospora sp. NPDC085879]|uniref:hypothetical protein n=1 Tax=Kitasatospora sp. NPDC085879 TaxID=3154769 RepID=UPI003447AC3D